MKDNNLLKLSLFDIMFIVLILALPVVFIGSFRHEKQNSKKAQIYKNNRLWATYDLAKDTSITISNKRMRMLAKIEKNKIRITESNCPRHTCVHTSWIGNPGQTIVCLPNKLIIEIKGKQDFKYDAESY